MNVVFHDVSNYGAVLETIEPSVPLLNIGTALSGLPFLYEAYIDGVPYTLVMDTGAVLELCVPSFCSQKRGFLCHSQLPSML